MSTQGVGSCSSAHAPASIQVVACAEVLTSLVVGWLISDCQQGLPVGNNVLSLIWTVADRNPPLLCSLAGLLVDSIFLISKLCGNRVGTLMTSEKGTKQELSPESNFPDIPVFSSFVLKLLQGPVT